MNTCKTYYKIVTTSGNSYIGLNPYIDEDREIVCETWLIKKENEYESTSHRRYFNIKDILKYEVIDEPKFLCYVTATNAENGKYYKCVEASKECPEYKDRIYLKFNNYMYWHLQRFGTVDSPIHFSLYSSMFKFEETKIS